jgi:hypothetical protein
MTCAVATGGDIPFLLGSSLRVCRILVGVRDGTGLKLPVSALRRRAGDIVELR